MRKFNQKPTIIVVSLLLLSCLFSNAEADNNKTVFSLRDWMTKDNEFKYKLVHSYINVAKEDNITMRLPVDYYIKEIDSLIQNSIKNGDEAGLDVSLGIALKTIATMEGDFDNGKNKLDLAKEFMGPVFFEEFMKRYPEKYNKLLQETKDKK